MRNKIPLLICFILGLNYGFSFAKSTVVEGKESTLAGKTLKLETFNQQIFDQPRVLDIAIADSLGTFSFSFDISDVRSVNLSLGSFKIEFFVEPGDSLHLDLPEYAPLTRTQLYDPYFKPDTYLVIPDGGKSAQLNGKILLFETFYDSLYHASMKSVVVYHNDSLVAKAWQKNFGSMPHRSFFERYKWYSSVSLYRMAYPFAKDSLIKTYFANEAPDLQNQAFWNAFNATFKSAIVDEGRNKLFPDMLGPVWKSDYVRLREEVKKYHGLRNDDMTDLVVLKGIYEAWFLFPDLHPMMEKLLVNGLPIIQNENLNTLTSEILHELTALLPGKSCPDYKLTDTHGSVFNLSHHGKYVLLGFVSPELLQCRRDFIAMDEAFKSFGDQLSLVNVVLYQSKKDFLEFMKSYTGDIRFVYPDQPEKLVRDFNVNGLPVYYLIGPTGSIIATPQQGGLVQMFEKLETLIK